MIRRVISALSSLRWQLTLAYVGLLAVLLAGLGVYQYVALRGSLLGNRVATLQSDYNSAHTLIVRLAAASGGGRQLCARTSAATARSVAMLIAQTTGHTVDVVVYTRSLDRAAQVPATLELPRVDSATLTSVLTTRTRSDAMILRTSGGDALVVAFPILVNAARCGVAQLSTPLATFDRVLGDEIVLMSVGGGAVLLLALLLGLALTSRTLRPLRRLTSAAEQLAA